MQIYSQIIEVVEKAKKAGLAAVVVYKPDLQTDQGEPEDPDFIICTHSEPEVIAALLGNYQVNGATVMEIQE